MPPSERYVSYDLFNALAGRVDEFVRATQRQFEVLQQLLLQRSGDEERMKQVEKELGRHGSKHQEHYEWRAGVREGMHQMEGRLGERMDRIELRQNRILWTFLGGLAVLNLIGALAASLAGVLPQGLLRTLLEHLG